jgi:hypothetical protein
MWMTARLRYGARDIDPVVLATLESKASSPRNCTTRSRADRADL